jgi:hypothetical protein
VLDVRKQLATLRRQLSRLSSVSALIEALPSSVCFDVALPPSTLVSSLAAVDAHYAPECLSFCEMSVYCREEASGSTAVFGRTVRESLGGIEEVSVALDLAHGVVEPAPEQAEAAALLRQAARLRAEALA